MIQMQNPYLIVILFLLISSTAFDTLVEWLNLKNFNAKLPKEFEGFYDAQKYSTSQEYLKTTTVFGLMKQAFMLPVIIGFILFGGFNKVDLFARDISTHYIYAGLIFAAILTLFSWVISVPFSLYSTFVIEEKFGFNKTTLKTFFTDTLKAALLGALLGAPLFAGILYSFKSFGSQAWLYCWGLTTFFQLTITFIAPALIMPLFNKFIPLEEGPLKKKIEDFARKQNFQLHGIFTMDGSKRSSKSNAFFTGFGKFRRIVLFDTLIKNHTEDELVAVLAHEIGHYKKKHIFKSILLSIFSTGLMFYVFSLLINNEGLFQAFQMEHLSIYASMIFIGILYSPISSVLSVISNIFSRKNEFEADQYAAQTFQQPETLVTALKKLSVDNLSNLTPHPLKVFLEYSHPPVIDRIQALRTLNTTV